MPSIPGFEASGRVVECGKDCSILGRRLLGKKVGFNPELCSGSYA